MTLISFQDCALSEVQICLKLDINQQVLSTFALPSNKIQFKSKCGTFVLCSTKIFVVCSELIKFRYQQQTSDVLKAAIFMELQGKIDIIIKSLTAHQISP